MLSDHKWLWRIERVKCLLIIYRLKEKQKGFKWNCCHLHVCLSHCILISLENSPDMNYTCIEILQKQNICLAAWINYSIQTTISILGDFKKGFSLTVSYYHHRDSKSFANARGLSLTKSACFNEWESERQSMRS